MAGRRTPSSTGLADEPALIDVGTACWRPATVTPAVWPGCDWPCWAWAGFTWVEDLVPVDACSPSTSMPPWFVVPLPVPGVPVVVGVADAVASAVRAAAVAG